MGVTKAPQADQAFSLLADLLYRETDELELQDAIQKSTDTGLLTDLAASRYSFRWSPRRVGVMWPSIASSAQPRHRDCSQIMNAIVSAVTRCVGRFTRLARRFLRCCPSPLAERNLSQLVDHLWPERQP